MLNHEFLIRQRIWLMLIMGLALRLNIQFRKFEITKLFRPSSHGLKGEWQPTFIDYEKKQLPTKGHCMPIHF